MSTYLELVNLAISEAGKDQDELTSGNFASPPDVRLYNRFKRWVNEGYKEIQMARNEWDFKVGRASVLVLPAIYIEEGDRAVVPEVGARFRGQDTGFELVVQQVVLEDGAWASGTAKATIYFTIPDTTDSSDFKFNEVFDEIGDVTVENVFRAKGWGRYNFSTNTSVPDFLELVKESAYIQSTGGSDIQDNTSSIGLTKLIYVDWNSWQTALDGWAGGRNEPYYITVGPNGDAELYPRPNKQYLLYFNYTKTDGTMVDFDDVPANLPERYHEICAWIAVRKSGMYDRDRAIVSRANELINQYRNSMERNLMPDVTFESSRFSRE